MHGAGEGWLRRERTARAGYASGQRERAARVGGAGGRRERAVLEGGAEAIACRWDGIGKISDPGPLGAAGWLGDGPEAAPRCLGIAARASREPRAPPV